MRSYLAENVMMEKFVEDKLKDAESEAFADFAFEFAYLGRTCVMSERLVWVRISFFHRTGPLSVVEMESLELISERVKLMYPTVEHRKNSFLLFAAAVEQVSHETTCSVTLNTRYQETCVVVVVLPKTDQVDDKILSQNNSLVYPEGKESAFPKD